MPWTGSIRADMPAIARPHSPMIPLIAAHPTLHTTQDGQRRRGKGQVWGTT